MVQQGEVEMEGWKNNFFLLSLSSPSPGPSPLGLRQIETSFRPASSTQSRLTLGCLEEEQTEVLGKPPALWASVPSSQKGHGFTCNPR